MEVKESEAIEKRITDLLSERKTHEKEIQLLVAKRETINNNLIKAKAMSYIDKNKEKEYLPEVEKLRNELTGIDEKISALTEGNSIKQKAIEILNKQKEDASKKENDTERTELLKESEELRKQITPNIDSVVMYLDNIYELEKNVSGTMVNSYQTDLFNMLKVTKGILEVFTDRKSDDSKFHNIRHKIKTVVI